jgi:hypothetical protein
VVVHQSHTGCSQRIDVRCRDLLRAVQGHVVESTAARARVNQIKRSTYSQVARQDKTQHSQVVRQDKQYVGGLRRRWWRCRRPLSRRGRRESTVGASTRAIRIHPILSSGQASDSQTLGRAVVARALACRPRGSRWQAPAVVCFQGLLPAANGHIKRFCQLGRYFCQLSRATASRTAPPPGSPPPPRKPPPTPGIGTSAAAAQSPPPQS